MAALSALDCALESCGTARSRIEAAARIGRGFMVLAVR
jgi:hypothetical protein